MTSSRGSLRTEVGADLSLVEIAGAAKVTQIRPPDSIPELEGVLLAFKCSRKPNPCKPVREF